MTDSILTDRLAELVLNWRVGPSRFLTGEKSWLAKWRFDPLRSLENAFLLLEHTKPARYVISQAGDRLQVEVEQHDGRIGMSVDIVLPRTITLAVARSLRVEV